MNGMVLHSLELRGFVLTLNNIRNYGKRDRTRLPAYKMVFHYLLHMKKSIQDCGPCWTFWQYPMERLCGMLQPLVRSRLHPYTNLVNNISMWETFNHIHFLLDVRDEIFPVEQVRAYEEDKVFGKEDSEQLWFPSCHYTLKDNRHCGQNTHQEMSDLRNFYIANVGEIDDDEVSHFDIVV